MRRTGSILTCVLVGIGGLLALPVMSAGSARADTITPVTQLANFQQIVVDDSAGYIFLSEGVGSYPLLNGTPNTGIVVTNLSGGYVTTLDSGDGVEGIALAPGGGTLYAALSIKSAVGAVAVSTITKPTPTQVIYPLSGTDVPYDVAFQSGKVWVSYEPGVGAAAGNSAIGDINLSAATPASAFEPGSGSWYNAPDLAADPDNSGVLVAANQGLSITGAVILNTTTDPATVIASGALGGTYTSTSCQDEYQIAVVPGGKQFIAACHSLEEFSVSNLTTPVNTIAGTSLTAVAAAVSPNGTIATGNTKAPYVQGDSETADAYVYTASGKLLNTLPVATAYYNEPSGVAIGGLAWSLDNSRLYVVTGTQIIDGITNSTHYSLDVIDEPTLPHPALTLSVPASSLITAAVKLSGKLTLPSGKALPTGTLVTITRTGASKATLTAKTLANGTFAVTDHTVGNALGTYAYTATYAGSATVAPAASTATVKVVKFGPGLSLGFNATTSDYGATTVITARLAKTYTNRTVWIFAQVARHARTLVGHGTVNSHGDFTVRYKASYTSTISAAFSGDAHVAAATASHLVRVKAAATTSIGGYYGTTSSGGITYRLYTTSDTLTTHTTVSPDKRGQCVTLEIWENDNGGAGWYFNSETGCLHLSASSQLSSSFSLSGASQGSGIQYRIRTDYAPTTDNTNLGNDSSWQYFIVY